MKRAVLTACGSALVVAACMAPERQQTAFDGAATGGAAGTGGAADASIDSSASGTGGVGGSSGNGGSMSGSGGAAGSGGEAGAAGAPIARCRWSRDSKRLFVNAKAEGPVSLAVAQDQSTYVLGNFEEDIDFGEPKQAHAEGASYITKIAKDGTHLWTRAIDGKGRGFATGSASSQGRTVFVGRIEPDSSSSIELDLSDFGVTQSATALNNIGWVLLLNAADSVAWHRVFTADSDQATALTAAAIDAAGDVIVVGSMRGTVDLGCGNPDGGYSGGVFVSKLDGSNGTCKWLLPINDVPDASVSMVSVAIGYDNEPVIAGSYWNDFQVLSTSVQLKAGQDDAFVLKLSSDGKAVRWVHTMGYLGADSASSVAVDGAGDVWVAGSFTEQINLGDGTTEKAPAFSSVYLLKLARTDGSHLAHKILGNIEIPTEHAVAAGPNNQVALTGTLFGDWDFGAGTVKAFNGDVFVAVYDHDLKLQWVRAYGDDSTQRSRAVGFFSSGDVALAGVYDGKLSFWTPCAELTWAENSGIGFAASVGPD